jgi:hypothetical protein
LRLDGDRRVHIGEPRGAAGSIINIHNARVGRKQGIPRVHHVDARAAEVGPSGGGRVLYSITVDQDVLATHQSVRVHITRF